MNTYLIRGNKTLTGNIKISGSKNALLPIIAGACITKSIITLNNIPPLEDTYSMIDILKYLNINVIYDNRGKMIIDARSIKNKRLDIEAVSKLRASYYFMGTLLALYKKVEIITPGGCKFMDRPIDLHLFAFDCLGITYKKDEQLYIFNKSKVKNKNIEFKKISVGATVNAILASVIGREKIRLINVAKEPEVDDLIDFLNKCGGDIKRKDNEIIINGVSNLHSCEYEIIDDRIEAQTYLIMGALLGNNLKIEYKNKKHISALIELFKEINVSIKECDKGYIVNKSDNIKNKDLSFDSYPSLASDIQPILAILFTRSKGESIFVDRVYPHRFTHIKSLVSMGYNMKVDNDKLIIRKNNCYLDSEVEAFDLRCGMSLVLGGLVSDKITKVSNTNYIKRGYCNLIDKIKGVGGAIEEI